MKRRLVSILACAAVVTGLLAGATTVHAEEKRTIAVVTIPLQKNLVLTLSKVRKQKQRNWEILILYILMPAGDMQKSIAIVEDMTTQGCRCNLYFSCRCQRYHSLY